MSVIIPTYGRGDFLVRAVVSVLRQTYQNLEIIIVDDNGVGTQGQIETEKMLSSYLEADKRIRYLKHEVNRNGSAARNTGIADARGEYLCFLDDDDEFFPDKVEKQVRLLEQLGEGWGACYCGTVKSFEHGGDFHYIPTESGDIFFEALTTAIDTCSGSTLMIKKKIVNLVTGFNTMLVRHQDYDFFARVAYYTKVAVVSEPMVKIYLHQGSYGQKTFRQLVDTREQYLKGMTPYMDKLTAKQRKQVYYEHHIVQLKTALKYHEYGEALKYYRTLGKMAKSLYRLLKDGMIYKRKMASGLYRR